MLLSNSCQAGDKNISASSTKKENTQTTQSLATTNTDGKTSGNTATVVKRNETQKPQQLSATDVLGDANITVDAKIAFVDSFAIMGECQEGQKARKDIEAKRDLATQEIQDDSKTFEKAKADYIAKSTMMTDSAREKEEKKLIKMERDLKNLVAEKEEELKLDMQIATETLAQGLEAGVAKLAKNEKFDVVFDKMTGRAIYVADNFNLTEKAIKEVDKNYQVKLAQNSKAEAAATKVADNKAVAAPKSAKAAA
jgi:outer membrane protein